MVVPSPTDNVDKALPRSWTALFSARNKNGLEREVPTELKLAGHRGAGRKTSSREQCGGRSQ